MQQVLNVFEAHRLGQVVIESCLQGDVPVSFLAPARYGNQRRALPGGLPANRAHHLQAGQLRHAHIEQCGIRCDLREGFQRLCAVIGHVHFVAFQTQQFRQAVGGIHVVVGDQNAAVESNARRCRGLAHGALARGDRDNCPAGAP